MLWQHVIGTRDSPVGPARRNVEAEAGRLLGWLGSIRRFCEH